MYGLDTTVYRPPKMFVAPRPVVPDGVNSCDPIHRAAVFFRVGGTSMMAGMTASGNPAGWICLLNLTSAALMAAPSAVPRADPPPVDTLRLPDVKKEPVLLRNTVQKMSLIFSAAPRPMWTAA